ncbi:cucumisin-like isoform X1 [Herrania umbratica]|uniref:Cucumisin-like isoform X1 n=1 Tax=Herrania umbratica TaxID=108875 RepID=A0A6J1B8B0_9ROSI|nr:cucumisin-like isoform X1 [Herrania umbratica]
MKGGKYLLPCLLLHGLFLALLTSRAASHSQSNTNRKSYIVYMGDRPSGGTSTSLLHSSMLQDVCSSDVIDKSVLYSYKRSFNGFAVELTEEEARKMAGMNGVVSVFPNEKKNLHTTRSWDFMGFSQQVERAALESDVIIGVLDTGIWPESESFNDQGLGPPPKKWKGSCQTAGGNFTCNNKIIGGQYYRSVGFFGPNDINSPRDSDGHGTHTASTAAGKLVDRASLLGFGSGTARGGVPSARIAAYKICWSDGCKDADILAAFDDAIADGVDIISISVGGHSPEDYFKDSISIGAFHAMKNGVLTVTSAGNDGPDRSTISNFSPWSLAAAASMIDRKFFTKVQLGNSEIYEGVSINTFDLQNKMYPMIYGGDAASSNATRSLSRYCYQNSLDQNLVKGKIVLCDALSQGRGPFSAGAVGTVMRDQLPNDYTLSFPLPASYLDLVDGSKIFAYINSTSTPTATIFKSNEANDSLAPYVVSFSSRGPNPITPDILKPDLSAPGVHVLAAWSLISPVSEIKGDNRFEPFNIISGTSMACPHVSAAAAYVKSFHPTWSPAAIKSALMTTAFPMSSGINLDAEFAYGSGNLNPIKAVNPGLVYDSEEVDYIKFLCGQGYSTRFLQLVTRDDATCSEATSGTVWDLNYPSFALFTSPLKPVSRTFNRTVTNVGSPSSTYTATLTAPAGALKIQVNPNVLSFTSLGQKLSFELTIEGTTEKSIVSASLEWDDGVQKVRSPIIVFI